MRRGAWELGDGPAFSAPGRRWPCGRRPVMAAAAVLLGACASRPAVPDAPQPIPWADTLPVPEPRERAIQDLAVVLGEATRDELGSAVSVRRRVDGVKPALNVDRFDEVVSSAWYEHRITAPGGMTPRQVAEGPPGAAPASGPLRVVDGKVGGVSPGFTVEDAKGERYLLKFDPPAYPGLASGADVVSSRLFWAAGYHVPKDVVVRIDPDDLRLDPDAEVETSEGERPMTEGDIGTALAGVPRGPDGRVRALASLFLSGAPKGEFRFQGTREDDPNDYYPHEHRRELRGLRVIASWLNHVDLQARNTLDMYVRPTGYLRHHLIDFGTTLGSGGIRVLNPREGREYAVDLWASLGRLTTLGAYRVGWEGEEGEPIHPSLGWLAVKSFDPARWKPFWPNEAFRRVTPADGYWGAKRVAALDSARVAAAVAEARYADPAAADTLVDILLLRRHRVLRHWFGEVAPLEEAEAVVGEGRGSESRADGASPPAPSALLVRFRDLGLEHGLWTAEESCYVWEVEEFGGTSGAAEPTEREGRVCDPAAGSGDPAVRTVRIPLAAAPSGPWEMTLEVAVERPGAEGRAARIWLRGDEQGRPRVVGLRH